MPTYEYICTNCGQKFEIKASMSEKGKGLKTTCPTCGGTQAQQVLSSVAVKSSSGGGGKSKGSSGGCGPGCGCHR